MEFDLDSKILMNKERLRYDYQNLRNLQNSYGYIVIYVSFIGLTFFDFVKYLKEIDYININLINLLFLICLLISLILVGFTIHLFLRLFLPKMVAHDKLPNYIYNHMFSKVSKWAKRQKKDSLEETKIAYIELLEKAVENNFKLYIYKRNLLYRTIKFALISLIPYFISMIFFNLLK